MSPDGAAGEFRRLVNLDAAELDHWLQTPESESVGITHDGEDEAVGHQAGRRIVSLLRAKQAPDDDDLAFIRKVVGYIHRHAAQRPVGDVADTRWRHSLMNWGHDPLR